MKNFQSTYVIFIKKTKTEKYEVNIFILNGKEKRTKIEYSSLGWSNYWANDLFLGEMILTQNTKFGVLVSQL